MYEAYAASTPLGLLSPDFSITSSLFEPGKSPPANTCTPDLACARC